VGVRVVLRSVVEEERPRRTAVYLVNTDLFGDDFLTADAGVVVPEMLAIEDDVVRVADAIDTDPAVPVAVAVRVGVGLFSTVLNSCRIERTRPILNSISRPG
jgi:hypothetical protein